MRIEVGGGPDGCFMFFARFAFDTTFFVLLSHCVLFSSDLYGYSP